MKMSQKIFQGLSAFGFIYFQNAHSFCDAGVMLMHNAVVKKNVVCVPFLSLEHEYPWKYHVIK